MYVRWQEFEAAMPEMAGAGARLVRQFGVGLAFLATVRADGAPRIHPICLNFHDGGLYGLILEPSPKRADLVRDGRCALHSFPPEDRDDEFFLSCRAAQVTDEATIAAVIDVQHASGGTTSGDETCFEFLLERALLATYKPRSEGNTWPPVYTRWSAQGNTAR